jgi:hypothetical protein
MEEFESGGLGTEITVRANLDSAQLFLRNLEFTGWSYFVYAAATPPTTSSESGAVRPFLSLPVRGSLK